MPRANDLMWSFVLVNLQGKSTLFCSPSTNSSNQFHGFTIILTSLYKPWPLVKCGSHMRSFLKKGPRGGSWIVAFNLWKRSLSLEGTTYSWTSPMIVKSSTDTLYYGLDIISRIPGSSKLTMESRLLTLSFSLASSNTLCSSSLPWIKFKPKHLINVSVRKMKLILVWTT